MNYTACGTPYYQAPEIFLNNYKGVKIEVPRFDLWSLGVLLFKMITGLYPFTGRSAAEIYRDIERKDGVTIPTNINVSEECKDVIRKLLVKKETERISFKELEVHPFYNDDAILRQKENE